MLVGRPCGGTAILYRKSHGNTVKVVPSANSCITGVSLTTERGPILLLTVYMPTEYNDEDSLEKYMDVCVNLNAIFNEYVSPHLMIAGDLNCHPGTRFFKCLEHLLNDNNLMLKDLPLSSSNSDVFTYCSDSGFNTSWIDHVICSQEVSSNVSNMKILYDCIC